jgi:(2R)-3-sulfolactate dehydrogenase (NADP+)
MADTIRLSLDEALALCLNAARAAGAREETARAIAISAVDAEAEGQPIVGLSHFIDYLNALEEGRIDGQALPVISRPVPAMFRADACGGAAHTGFDLAFDDLVAAARAIGLALFSQRNAYTAGSLGYYGTRLAEHGLASIACANGPALITGGGATKPIYCTNPVAFVAPVADGPPLIIDQSSSATAFVSVRQAAADGRSLPEGWALDSQGRPTTDPAEAMKGALLTFGGARGANIALMVDVLAAGVSGAKWSIDAGSITEGNASPGCGLFVLVMAPELVDPDFSKRMAAQIERLSRDYGVHIPGLRKADARERAARDGISVSKAVYESIAKRR